MKFTTYLNPTTLLIRIYLVPLDSLCLRMGSLAILLRDFFVLTACTTIALGYATLRS